MSENTPMRRRRPPQPVQIDDASIPHKSDEDNPVLPAREMPPHRRVRVVPIETTDDDAPRHLPESPLFCFGEGLSYTKFAYSNLRMDADALQARVTLANVGTRAGSETVQVYVRDLVSSVITPVKRLIAFQKVSLAAGEGRELVFSLKREDFSLILPSEQRVVEPGAFALFVGGSSKDADLLRHDFSL